MAKIEFSGVLRRAGGVGSWVTVQLPAKVSAKLGAKGRVPVKATLNGYTYRSSALPNGAGGHFLVVNEGVREGAKADIGDTVKVILEVDTKPRVVKAPADLARALAASKQAKANWDKLAYSHQKAYLDYIEEAKKPETRARRVLKAVELLAKNQKLK